MTRRERLERKLEKRREWADKAEVKSERHFKTGHDMFSVIPMGQPILVGHHSEKRDRNYRGRAAGHLDKGVEFAHLAEHHEAKAGGIENQLENSIFSDDSNAVEALEARIAENEAKRERMKLVNKLYKKQDAAGLAALGIDLEKLKEKLAAAGGYWGKAPHLPYELSNLGQRISGDKKRLEQVKMQNTRREAAEAAPNGVTFTKCQSGYCRITFAEKPDRSILNALKAAGFYWGQGSWAGKEESLPAEVKDLLEKGAN